MMSKLCPSASHDEKYRTDVELDFFVNRMERQLGFDLNGDGYIGGEGK